MEFVAATPVEAWKQATAHLIASNREAFNVGLQFPADAASEDALRDFDPRTVLGSGFDIARDVANTIFPSKSWAKTGVRTEFYRRYLAANARRRHGRWGTYFQRMISFGPNSVNQLEGLINALNTWRTSPKAALYCHLSAATVDNPRPLGAPCLQYVQFCCPDRRTLALTAIYRNHDYCNKVLGNLIGLARLLSFVAAQTNRTATYVTVLSVHAYFDTSVRNQKRLARLD
jgi:hypothetical protein